MQNVLVDRAPLRLRRPARLLRLASDERLVALVREGDEGAFEALYDRHHPAILGFCRHMLGTREEAEDAVQHTFLSAFRDLVASDKPIDLRPWLFAIARNRCLSLLRARRAHVEIDLAEPATDGLTATVERREDLRELLADLASLPEDQRAALLLAELGALDHAGIATVLDCPREKVKALVFQARSSLAASREARATPCEQIRVELATASGAALRRGPLRRHLRTCAGCRAFKAEVSTQRRLLALALPVVPTVALKASVLGGGTAASGGGTAVAAGTTAGVAGTPGGAIGGLLGTVASTSAGKVAVSLAVAGVVVSGGALTQQLRHAAAAPAAPAHATPGAAVPGGATDLWPSQAGASAGSDETQRRHAAAHRGGHPSTAGGGEAPAAGAPDALARTAPWSGSTPSTPAPRGTGSRPTAPGGAGTPPGQSGNAPGQQGTAPGQSGTAPGQQGTAPGQSGTTPGQQGSTPGQQGSTPGHSGPPPGQGGPVPGQSGGSPGQAGASPGQTGASPGAGSSPGQAGSDQGQGGNAPGHGILPPGHGGTPPGHIVRLLVPGA